MLQVRSRYALFVFALLAASTPALAEQAKLETTGDMRPFAGEFHTIYGMSDRGDVVGEGLFERPAFPTNEITHEGLHWQASTAGINYLGKLPGGGATARSNGVSANGSVVVGSAMHGVPRAVRRASNVLSPLEPVGSDSFASSAEAVSGNGLVIAGYAEKWSGSPRAFRWTSAEGLVQLGSLAGETGTSVARGVSSDGSVIVGETEVAGGATHAFRWTSTGMVDLGTIGGAAGDSRALGVSTGGLFVVGESTTESGATRAFLYTEGGSMVALPTLGDHAGDSVALSVSADGKTVAGASASEAFPDGEACIWFDGVPVSMREMLADRYGMHLGNFPQFKDARCSADGLRFAGNSTYSYQPTLIDGGPMEAGYRVTVAPNLQPPLLETDVAEGSTQYAKVGETLRLNFRFSDPDVGGSIQINGWQYPGGTNRATLTPPIGTTSNDPIDAVWEWTPSTNNWGHKLDCYISYSDKFGTSHRRSFSVQVEPNLKPTADPIEPKVVECEDGVHTVALSTTVHDAENAPLLCKWLVNGAVIQEIDNVVSGTTLTFEHEYEHGEHEVEFRVWDKWNYPSTSIFTTVTVQDTEAPILFVTNHVTSGTDPGVDYATILELPEPTVTDASGHAVVSLEHDGTGSYPLGETSVTWTATDEFGNVGTAVQKVTVEDREAPTLVGSASVQFNVDPGKLFSSATLPEPAATDNVDDDSAIQVISDAPLRFPIGTTKVMFTAIDGGGNAATWPMDVTVVNRAPQADSGPKVVVTTTSEKGLRVALDGSASSDPDDHKLKFAWSAPGVKFAGAKSAKPSGFFPVGRTFATLTVKDPAGASHTDRVRVVVKLKNSKPRPAGAAANASFANSLSQAKQAAGSESGGASSLAGLSYASAAVAYGDAAGEFVRWEEDQSESDALLSYSELRALQRAYGEAATASLLAAYAETGDESLLAAALSAAEGSAYAGADLTER